MNTKKFALCFLMFSIAFSSSAFAFPCAFFGTVKIDGNPINGTLVTAHLNDTGALLATAEEVAGFGNYTVTIDSAGSVIRLKIAGAWVDEPTQICDSGNVSYLDLTIATQPDGSPCDNDIICNSTFCVHDVCRPTDPYVGDSFCDAGENCKNSADCPCPSGQSCDDSGNCFTPQPPQQGGGVIQGGGGFVPTCTEKWNCTDWSECVAGTQARTCKDDNKCGTTKSKPDETQTCTEAAPPTGGVIGGETTSCTEDWTCIEWSACDNGTRTRTCVDKNTCGTTVNKPAEAETCTVSPATGLFLFFNSPTGYGAAALILVLVIAAIYLISKRRKDYRYKPK